LQRAKEELEAKKRAEEEKLNAEMNTLNAGICTFYSFISRFSLTNENSGIFQAEAVDTCVHEFSLTCVCVCVCVCVVSVFL
jgi:hypothetical protein